MSHHPIILVHGIFDSARIFRKMADFFREHGYRTFTPSLSPSSGKKGLDELGQQLKEYIEETLPQNEHFDLIGFSMGGIVSRFYIQRLGGMERVRKFISISSPHHGSLTAYLLNNAACKQMRPGSDFLNALNRGLSRLERLSFASIWTPFDLMILPAHSSRTSIGENIKLSVPMHPLMVTDNRVLKRVLGLLEGVKNLTP